jgi:hypothetical protein
MDEVQVEVAEVVENLEEDVDVDKEDVGMVVADAVDEERVEVDSTITTDQVEVLHEVELNKVMMLMYRTSLICILKKN